MEDDDFRMPSLHILTTKTLQLGALHLVRSALVTSYNLLNGEGKHLRWLLSNSNNQRGHMNFQEQ